MQLDLLVLAAHPDDAELGCGGTIATLSEEGKKIGILDLTEGEMGTRGTIETRRQEARKASEILGVTFRTNLNLGDSLLENTRENQLEIIKVVRQLRPTICIVGAPWDRHPDHGKATTLSLDALFYAGLRKLETFNEDGSPQEPWRPIHILHHQQDRPMEPDFIFDISDKWDTKVQAMLAYSTQFNVTDPEGEPETYISSERYFKQLEGRARYFGHLGGFEFGEAFKYYNGPVPLKNFDPFLNVSVKR